MRILLAEDDAVAGQTLTGILTAQGHEVTAVVRDPTRLTGNGRNFSRMSSRNSQNSFCNSQKR